MDSNNLLVNSIRDEFVNKKGFLRSNFDHCVYFRVIQFKLFICFLYVDDMLIAYKDKVEIGKLKEILKNEFKNKRSWYW